MSPPSQPNLRPVQQPHPHVSPCPELIGLREKFEKMEPRFNELIDGKRETDEVLRNLGERVGFMRPDGTPTPHSLVAAVQNNTNEVMSLRRSIEERMSSDPPQRLLDALDDDPITDITRHDIQRPVHTSRKLRSVSKQRNWMAIGIGIGTMIVGIIEAFRAAGIKWPF